MDIQELLKSLINQASAKTVYGDPISGEGRTIVPVAKVRCGFGGGSGRKSAENEGRGGGGGLIAHPVGYIEITSAGTRFVPILDAQALIAAVGLGLLMGVVVGRLFRS